MKYYYYDNGWYSYEYLHSHYGITSVPTMPVILYDVDLTTYSCWEDQVETWITDQWYLRDDVPYYRKSSDLLRVYRIDVTNYLECYDKLNDRLHKYDNHLYSFQYIHDHYGITMTPSTVYGVIDGIIWSWYNPDEAQYWDDTRKVWSPIPPEHQVDPDADIDAVGAIGLFYYTEPGNMKGYGSDIRGEYLHPISISFPQNGNFSVTSYTQQTLTGTWRLLSVASQRTATSPCIVMAMKIADSQPQESNVTNLGIDIPSELVDL